MRGDRRQGFDGHLHMRVVLDGPGDHPVIDLIELILEVGSELLPILSPLIGALMELRP